MFKSDVSTAVAVAVIDAKAPPPTRPPKRALFRGVSPYLLEIALQFRSNAVL